MLRRRWHEGDADKILPSLYAGRRAAKKRAPEEETSSGLLAAKERAVAEAPRSTLLGPPTVVRSGSKLSDPFLPD